MNFADLLLLVMVFSALLAGCYLLRQFYLAWKTGTLDQSPDKAPSLPLPWPVFLLFVAGFVLCYREAHDYVIHYALAFILGTLIFHVGSPSKFWNLHRTGPLSYLLTGLKTYLLIFIPIGLVGFFCSLFFSWLGFQDINQPTVELFMHLQGYEKILIFFIQACLLAPLWEEITFRGFVYPFLKSKINRNGAILISALLFSGMHMHLPSFIPLAFFGAILALLYEKTGSLGNSILLHACFNFSTCFTLLLLKYCEWLKLT